MEVKPVRLISWAEHTLPASFRSDCSSQNRRVVSEDALAFKKGGCAPCLVLLATGFSTIFSGSRTGSVARCHYYFVGAAFAG